MSHGGVGPPRLRHCPLLKRQNQLNDDEITANLKANNAHGIDRPHKYVLYDFKLAELFLRFKWKYEVLVDGVVEALRQCSWRSMSRSSSRFHPFSSRLERSRRRRGL